jgi:putative transposase
LSSQFYPSDLSDAQWELIENLIPKSRRGGRPRTTSVRQVVNAVFYLNRTGCAWRYLPAVEFPPWRTVYDYFTSWRNSGVWKQIHDFLVAHTRKTLGRNEKASTLIIDAQSSKAPAGESRGYDGFKKVQGRKRNVFVDTLGLVHGVKVDAANRKEHHSAIEMLRPDQSYFPCGVQPKLSAFYADGGYKAHDFQNEVRRHWGVWPTLKTSQSKIHFEKAIPKMRSHYREVTTLQASNLKPVRWIVERTFAWFNHYRRLAKDYERKTTHSEAMIYVAMTQLMLRRCTSSH